MNSPIKKWHEVVATQDHELLKSILSENVGTLTYLKGVISSPTKLIKITYIKRGIDNPIKETI